MRLTRVTPMLGVSDIERTLAFYRDQLGFRVGATNYSHGRLTWAYLQRDEAEIMIAGDIANIARDDARAVLGCVMLYFYADDVRALRAEIVARGVDASAPVQRFYGMLEVQLSDPDGYTLIFGQDTGETFEPE